MAVTLGCYVLLAVLIVHFENTVVGRTLKDFPEECFTAAEIDDDTRAFDNYNVPTSKADDLDLKKGWYRIMGKSANSLKQGFDKALVGSKLNAPNFCGTVYAGTLMGEHPTVAEGMVQMTVCFRKRFCFYSNIDACECKSKRRIYVRNCQNHFIYWLSPTNRQERYCTGRTSLKGAKIIFDKSTSSRKSMAVECRQYKTFEGDARIWDKVADVRCEKKQGWYRFSASSGSELASQCSINEKPISRLAQPCGTAFRGWVVDRHPTLREERRNSRVCFSYPDSCSCEFFSNIAIRNCGGYYVYQIQPPPICNARYCGAPNGSTVRKNDLRKPELPKKKNICNMYNVLHDPNRLWSYTSPTESNCDAKLYGQFRFGSKYTAWSIKEGCSKEDMKTVTHRCGARFQGYLEERPPTVSEGYVERIICFQDAKVPCECQFGSIIGVQNCSGFYVYDLRGVPQCQSRFCMVANGSESIKIDSDRPPLYDIPSPGYTVVAVQKSERGSEDDKAAITTTVLCIIILIVLILIVIIILTVLYVAHPVLWPRRKKEFVVVDSLSEGVNVEESTLEKESEDHGRKNNHQYTSLPDAPPQEEDDIIKRPDSEEVHEENTPV